MANERVKQFNALLEGKTAKQLEGFYMFQNQKNSNNGKVASDLSGIAFRKLLQSNTFDYVRENHIASNVKKNAGSIMEYLVARDIFDKYDHKVDNKKGVDVENGRWNYEIKLISVDSASHGYSTLEEWKSTFAPSNKILLVVIENKVYRIYKTHTNEFLDQASFKKDRKELRLRYNKQTLKAIQDNGTFIDTVALF